jgi:hypothetical protein
MKEIGVSVDFSKELTDSDYETIEEEVSEYLQAHGFDDEYETTDEGIMCESILDIL